MGVYADIISGLSVNLPENLTPLNLDNRSAFVFSKPDLSSAQLHTYVKNYRLVTVLSQNGGIPDAPNVSYGIYRGEPRINMSASTEEAFVQGPSMAIFLWPFSATSGGLIWELVRKGIREFAFIEPAGWEIYGYKQALIMKMAIVVGHILSSPRRISQGAASGPSEFIPAGFEPLLDRKYPLSEERRPLNIIHYTSSLYCGGAERQLCYLAMAQKRMGHNVRVNTCWPLEGDCGHYADSLLASTIPHGSAGITEHSEFRRLLSLGKLDLEMLRRLPDVFRNFTLDLLGEILANKPDVLHASLDHPNIVAGAAGMLTSVPAIILSTRNVNPTNFPRFYHPCMKDWYQFLIRSPRVHLIANSRNGARDYAEWLGISHERFHVVLNGLDFNEIKRPGYSEIAEFRNAIGVDKDTPLLTGVFRIDPEKQPLAFVNVVKRVVAEIPRLKVVIAGIGCLEKEMRAAVKDAGMDSNFIFLGRRPDIPIIMAASNVLLLTSCAEGTPNVLLEAQYLGCPVVATKAGGIPDAVSDQRTGFLHEINDTDGLARSVLRLLRNPELCAQFKSEGLLFVERQFGLKRMADESMRLYYGALGWADPSCGSESVVKQNLVRSGIEC